MATGTIAITQAFTILSTWASVSLEVKDGTAFDKVTAGGAAVIKGTATVTASADYEPAAGTPALALITATGGLTGTFSTVTIVRNPFQWDHPTNQGKKHYWEEFYTGTTFSIQVQLQSQQPPPGPPPSPPPYPPPPPGP
jgi:hypothetical protein